MVVILGMGISRMDFWNWNHEENLMNRDEVENINCKNVGNIDE